jgi:hypothetical protein
LGDKIVNLFGSIIVLAIVTTLVLPKRQTVGVIQAGGGTFVESIKAAMGNGAGGQ